MALFVQWCLGSSFTGRGTMSSGRHWLGQWYCPSQSRLLFIVVPQDVIELPSRIAEKRKKQYSVIKTGYHDKYHLHWSTVFEEYVWFFQNLFFFKKIYLFKINICVPFQKKLILLKKKSLCKKIHSLKQTNSIKYFIFNLVLLQMNRFKW